MTSTNTTLYFITGNAGKLREMQQLVPGVEQLQIDLPEIQSLDPHEIINAKLEAAFKHHAGPFMVEDTSLCIEGLGGLPGPFVKWFLQAVKPAGIYQMAQASGNTKAIARTIIGYALDADHITYYEGTVEGSVVEPVEGGFGWDAIFMPNGETKRFSEMSMEEKNSLSMRRKAAEQLAKTREQV